MLDIKDEYIRDYSFDPEFIKRKDSLDTHKDRLEKTHVLNKRKHNSIDIHNMIDAEVTVIISRVNPAMSQAWTLENLMAPPVRHLCGVKYISL